MFGFMRPQANPQTNTPATGQQDILVSSEDIYRFDLGPEPILLLRKGFELSVSDLPRFLKNGAKRHQFHYKQNGQRLAKLPPQKLLPGGGMANALQESARREAKIVRIPYKKALIVEPDPKHLKRLMDCLFVCGIPLDQIHPVRMASNAPWAVDKYRPQILVANYDLANPIDGLSLLQAFSALSFVESLILVLPSEVTLSTAEWSTVRRIQQQKPLQVLTRPVNRFDLRPLIPESRQWRAVNTHQEKPVA